MNKAKLRSMIIKKSNGDNNISAQLYQMFFFERILERISKSKYKNNIILKGGLLLASIIGEEERTTKDMDATLKSLPLDTEKITNIFNEILSVDLGDEVKFEILDVKDIREEDQYGGVKINILSTMETLKIHLAIELTVGDKITPREITYNYNCIFEDKKIPILAYTLETVIAEKYHCIVTRGVANTRMKDFYDIYVLLKENKEKIDFNNLTKAIKNTFDKRSTVLDLIEIKETLQDIKESERLSDLWKNYQLVASYSKNISFLKLFEPLEEITKTIEKYIALKI